jgi:hypothetical protein
MRKFITFLACVLAGWTGARAQFGNFSDVPVEINAQETRIESGLAVA